MKFHMAALMLSVSMVLPQAMANESNQVILREKMNIVLTGAKQEPNTWSGDDVTSPIYKYYDENGKLRLEENMAFKIYNQDEKAVGFALFGDKVDSKLNRKIMNLTSKECPVTATIHGYSNRNNPNTVNYRIENLSTNCAIPKDAEVPYDDQSY